MSADIGRLLAGSPYAGHPWRLRLRQIRVVVALEWRKHLADRRSLWVYLLALSPVVLMGLMALIATGQGSTSSVGSVAEVYGQIFEGLILRGVVYLGCVGIFMALFRGEVLQGSLHYYLLAPIHRETLVVGKYLSGLLVAVPVFGLSAVLTLIVTYVPFALANGERELLAELLIRHGAVYLGIVVLACLGYGAVFLAAGLFFRNPILPAAVILGWEYINFLLPPVLKRLSIVYYLRSLRPVAISEGPFALLTDPTPAWLAVSGLLAVTLLLVVLAAVGSRRLEIDYGSE